MHLLNGILRCQRKTGKKGSRIRGGSAAPASGQCSVVPRQRRGVVRSTCRRGENRTNTEHPPRPPPRPRCVNRARRTSSSRERMAHEFGRGSSSSSPGLRGARPQRGRCGRRRSRRPVKRTTRSTTAGRSGRLERVSLAATTRCGRGKPADNAPFSFISL